MLTISPDLQLDDQIVTETIAMLAKRGGGKSNAAVLLAEQMTDAGYQWVAIDPKGDWWGIRSAADGEHPGLPIPVFGGLHGDIPLQPAAGALMAQLVIDRGITCVLDVSEFSKAEQIRFVTDFAETLFKLIRHAPRAMHVFLEEAEEFLPQRVEARAARMVGAYSKISKQGRTFGLGVTLITQRSASLNKDALSQTDTLVVFRTPSPHDRKAIAGWLEHHEEASDVAASLSELEPGESWIISPGFLGRIVRVRWNRRRTFDSGATPVAGARRRSAPVSLADIDLDEVAALMAETIEAAKADDPRELRARIRQLEQQLAERQPAEPVVEVREVHLLDEDLVARVEVSIDQLRTRGEECIEAADGLAENIRIARTVVRAGAPAPEAVVAPAPPQRPTPRPKPTTTAAAGDLGKAEKVVLTVLVQHPEGRTKTQIALLSGYSIKSSGLSNALGRLRSLGYATKGGTTTQATPAGIAALGDVEPLPTGHELLEHWRSQLGKAEKACLDAFVDAWPHELDKPTVADRTGYSSSSSGLSNALGRLRSLELVDGWKASDDLMASIGR